MLSCFKTSSLIRSFFYKEIIWTFYLFFPGLQEPSLLASKSEKYCPSCKMGSLSNNDGNEKGRKPIGLLWQNNNFARASRFFVHFLAVTARLRRENV